MRYAKLLGIGAIGLALACNDTSEPNSRIDSPVKPQFTVAGAGFTTINPAVDNPTDDPEIDLCLNGPGTVNCNLYGDKSYVWINGGPNQTGPSALSDGVYFFTVLEPSGQNDPNDGGANVLSDTDPAGGSGTTGGGDLYTARLFSTSGGDISDNLGTHDEYLSATQGLQIRLMPYDDTSNPGGVYILAICRIDLQKTYDATTKTYDVINDPVDPASCKYDAFKAVTGDIIIIDEFPEVSGLKYYDANVNGRFDAGEVGIAGWPIHFENGTSDNIFTGAGGTFTVSLVPDVYTFQELVANAPWMQTGNTLNQSLPVGAATLAAFIYSVTVGEDDITGLNFGNVCVGRGGGLTLGFWSNKNGESAQFKPAAKATATLAFLTSLNLRNANGTAFDPTTYTQFRNWLLSASATNMAYMLSAQLAAMELNVRNGNVLGTSIVYGGSTLGFLTIADLMSAANTELGLHGSTVAASADRTYQEQLKTALDNANNNLNFVQPTPATCPTPVFPS